MSLNNIFGIAGTALNAQMVRMNATASNMANSLAPSRLARQRPLRLSARCLKPCSIQQMTTPGAQYVGGVRVSGHG